jgi:hypothetical protein
MPGGHFMPGARANRLNACGVGQTNAEWIKAGWMPTREGKIVVKVCIDKPWANDPCSATWQHHFSL